MKETEKVAAAFGLDSLEDWDWRDPFGVEQRRRQKQRRNFLTNAGVYGAGSLAGLLGGNLVGRHLVDRRNNRLVNALERNANRWHKWWVNPDKNLARQDRLVKAFDKPTRFRRFAPVAALTAGGLAGAGWLKDKLGF